MKAESTVESIFSTQQLETLYKLIGREVHLEDLMRNLTFFVRDLRPPRVGAMQVGCSDEAEKECCDVFQRRFAEHFLPHLKFATSSPFRTANLGGRYEWGSYRLAEMHFALPNRTDPWTLMLVKLNSHVSVARGEDGPAYGKRQRYQHQEDSYFCGALQDLLEGGQSPSAKDLREAFHSEGKDRIQTLLDPQLIDPALRSLFAAIVNARLQARKCIVDLQDQAGPAPVSCIVLPCVTLNRPGRDTEMVCGVYAADRRVHPAAVSYCGLEADAETFLVEYRVDRLIVSSKKSLARRQARDHRQLLKRAAGQRTAHLSSDVRLDKIRSEAQLSRSSLQPYAGVLFKSLLGVLLELSPLPAVLLLFGEGLVDIHHIFRLQQLARKGDSDQEARSILAEVDHKVDAMSPQRVRQIVELLLQAYGLRLGAENKQPSSGVSRESGKSRAVRLQAPGFRFESDPRNPDSESGPGA